MENLKEKLLSIGNITYTSEYENEIMCKSLESTGSDSTIHLIIAMEELAELTQAISKAIRCNCNSLNLLEEIADVELVLKYLYEIFDIDKYTVDKIKYLKLKRLEDNLNGE